MCDTGWWQVLLDGLIGAGVGGVVAALTAWGVVAATKRHERAMTREQAMREDIVALQRHAGMLLEAVGDHDSAAAGQALTDVALGSMTLSVHDQGRTPGLMQWTTDVTSEWAELVLVWQLANQPFSHEEYVDLMKRAAHFAALLTTWSHRGFPAWDRAAIDRAYADLAELAELAEPESEPMATEPPA